MTGWTIDYGEKRPLHKEVKYHIYDEGNRAVVARVKRSGVTAVRADGEGIRHATGEEGGGEGMGKMAHLGGGATEEVAAEENLLRTTARHTQGSCRRAQGCRTNRAQEVKEYNFGKNNIPGGTYKINSTWRRKLL